MIFLELCAASQAPASTFANQTVLTNGSRLSFNIDEDIGGGSGGTEGELVGDLNLNGKVLSVTCRDQSEMRTNPAWCLRYLRHLRPIVQKQH